MRKPGSGRRPVPVHADGNGCTFRGKGRDHATPTEAWTAANGPVPEGMVVGHVCGQTACLTMEHMLLTTRRDEALKVVQEGRHPQADKTHCPKGHEYTAENTDLRVYPTHTSRRCKACHAEACRAYKQRTRASRKGGA